MSQVGLYSKKVGAQDLTAALSVFWGFYSPMNCSLVPLVVGTCVLSLFNPQWNSLHFLRLLHDQNQGMLRRDDRDFIVPDFRRRLYERAPDLSYQANADTAPAALGGVLGGSMSSAKRQHPCASQTQPEQESIFEGLVALQSRSSGSDSPPRHTRGSAINLNGDSKALFRNIQPFTWSCFNQSTVRNR